MFYTKFRPQTFAQIIGQSDIVKSLQKQVADKTFGHAYLFVGSRGVGKTTTARIFAKAINCLKPSKTGDVCDKCTVCEGVKLGNYNDLIEIDGASNRGIDDVRELRERMKLSPSSGKYKVYIIDEVHMLTTEAFNALLKTLEEPPSHAVFILCTTELQKVPETVKSRCQIFKFKRASIKDIQNKLKAISEAEKIKIADADIAKIAAIARGGFRDAETMFQQISEGGMDIKTLSGFSDPKEFIDFTNLLISKNSKACLESINRYFEGGVDLSAWTFSYLTFLRDLLILKSGTDFTSWDYSDEELKDLGDAYGNMSFVDITNYLDGFLLAYKDLKSAVISQLPLEVCVIKLCAQKNVFEEVSSTEPTSPQPPRSVEPKNVIKPKVEQNSSSDLPRSQKIHSKPSLSFDDINAKWVEVLKQMSKINNSVMVLLKSCKLLAVEGSAVKVEVPFDFHKERLQSNSTRSLVENLLQTVYGYMLSLDIVVKKPQKPSRSNNLTGTLTDMNIAPAEVPAESLFNYFDGNLPQMS